MITIGAFTPADYPMVAKWWKAHGWPVLPLEALPEGGGVIAYEGTTPLCAAWLYKTNSSISWMEWFISNPDAPKRCRSLGLDAVIAELDTRAKAQGFKIIHTSMRHPGLIRRMKSHGFIVVDEGMTNLARVF